MAKIVQKAKENPMMTAILTLSIITGAAIGIWEGVQLVDVLHVTEQELVIYDAKPHTYAVGLEQKIIENGKISKCLWLKSEIRALADSIYVRKRDSADADYIHDLETDLKELEDDYSVLGCAALLV